MTVPYCTPGAAGVSLASCLAASEMIDQYLGGGSLAYETAALQLRAFANQMFAGNSRLTVALPKRPIIEAVISSHSRQQGSPEVQATIRRTLGAPGAVYSPIDKITLTRSPWAPFVYLEGIWGWPKPDRADTRTHDVGAIIAGDVDSSTALADGLDSPAGECWWLFKPGDTPHTWHCETAYVKDDGSLERYAEASGSATLDGGKAQRIEWPEGLIDAANTAARRLEQLKKSPGFKGYDTAPAQAVLHNITRNLDRYRP